MSGNGNCPDSEVWRQLMLGQIAAAEAERLEQHLAGCGRCVAAVQAVHADDTLVHAARAAAKLGDDPESHVIQQLIARCEMEGVPADAGDTVPPPSHTVMPDLGGTVLGEYKIIRVLGRGGMGHVYLAEQTALGRQVAIKVMRPELTAPHALKRFQAEARAVARLAHPNIVQVFNLGEQNGVYYIALEYVAGTSLSAYMAKRGPLPLALALGILRQVAAALQHAGEHGIVHRDIKPENILLTANGDAKVADFGLARCTAEASTQRFTSTGVVMGTPHYMSPEQIECKPVDSRSDIYSLGVTAYHMLAGRPPYLGASPFETAMRHIEGKPVPLGELRADLPAEVVRVVHKMMARAPVDRYASGSDLLKDLNRLPGCGGDRGPEAGDLAHLLGVRETPTGVQKGEAPGTRSEKEQEIDSITPPASLGRFSPRLSRLTIAAGSVAVCFLLAGLVYLLAHAKINTAPQLARDLENKELAGPFGGRTTKKGLVIPMPETVEAVAFSPDGKFFASGPYGWLRHGSAITVWNYASGEELFKHSATGIRCLVFSPNSQTLAAGTEEGASSLRLIDMRDQSERLPLSDAPPGSFLRAAVFSPDGTKIAVAIGYKNDTNTVKLLDSSSGKVVRDLVSHTGLFYGLAFSPDGRSVASGGHDKIVKITDIATGNSAHEDLQTTSEINSLAFSPDGKLAVATIEGVDVWDPAFSRRSGIALNAHSIALSPDGKVLAVGSGGGPVYLVDFATLKILTTLQGHTTEVMGMAFSPDGRTLATASWDKTVRLWDVSGRAEPSRRP